MEHAKVLDEINYYRAQKIAEMLYRTNMISFVEYDRLTAINRSTFSPLYADLLPETLEIPSKES